MKTTTLPWILAILLSLAIGFGVGVSIQDEAPQVPNGPAASESPPHSEGRDATSNTVARQAASSPRALDLAARQAAVEQALTERDTLSTDPAQGSGRIDGVVVTRDGSGLEEVVVIATKVVDRSRTMPSGRPPLLGRAAPTPRSLDETLREAAARWASEERRRFQVVTDESGRFAFEDLPDGRYRMTAFCQGFEVKLPDMGLLFSPGDSARFVAVAVHEVEFDLRLPDGSQPEAATVTVVENHGSQSRVWTPDFRLS